MVSVISPLTEGAIESALNLTNLYGTGSDVVDADRFEFIFSSRYRDLLRRSDNSQQAQWALRHGPQANVSSSSPGGSLVGVPKSAGADLGPVKMPLNPTIVRFTQPKRYVVEKTMGGTDFHFFSDMNYRDMDIMTISIEGSTGNLNVYSDNPYEAEEAEKRLRAFHSLLALTEEGMLIQGSDRVMRNVMTFTMQSVIHSSVYMFEGFFTKRMEFAESADSPYSRKYVLEFIVLDTPSSVAAINSLSAPQYAPSPTNVPKGSVPQL